MRTYEVPKFRRREFLETDKPYAFILENAKTPLEQEQLLEIIGCNATGEDIKNFRSMYFAYKNECTKGSKINRTRGAKK